MVEIEPRPQHQLLAHQRPLAAAEDSGQPGLRLTGGALKRLEAITPPGMTARLDVTLTDEPPLAQAVVIITALPAVVPAAVPAE